MTPDPNLEKEPSGLSEGWKTGLVIVGTLLLMYLMANLEIVRRARNAYNRGEEHFNQKMYKQAMWDYQEVQEFYYLPHTHWVDQAAEKEFICRAYLGDWIPPEGPLDADVRQIRAAEFAKYQSEVAQITPVGDTSYNPAPETTLEKDLQKKAAQPKKKK
jgi:hypothetical protein